MADAEALKPRAIKDRRFSSL